MRAEAGTPAGRAVAIVCLSLRSLVYGVVVARSIGCSNDVDFDLGGRSGARRTAPGELQPARVLRLPPALMPWAWPRARAKTANGLG